ncbi:hypothetical protein FQN49_008528 [Arthroderma sp. PD_2]|nr:hypothetical protein FQN49_008528 [Arthroderma sp. PD_2]
MKRSQDETQSSQSQIPKPSMERKPAPPMKEERKPAPLAKEESVSPVLAPAPAPAPVRDMEPVSPVSPIERKPAAAFSSFSHQSPIVDQPAFAPVDTPPAVETKEIIPEPVSVPAPVPAPAPAPIQSTQPTEVKTFTVEAEKEVPAVVEEVPALDRWAQIRKNAAQRAAVPDAPAEAPVASAPTTPQAKEPTTQQETIEMRAARIKARVAELTKNMESSRGN